MIRKTVDDLAEAVLSGDREAGAKALLDYIQALKKDGQAASADLLAEKLYENLTFVDTLKEAELSEKKLTSWQRGKLGNILKGLTQPRLAYVEADGYASVGYILPAQKGIKLFDRLGVHELSLSSVREFIWLGSRYSFKDKRALGAAELIERLKSKGFDPILRFGTWSKGPVGVLN